jgi:hypothetical protein
MPRILPRFDRELGQEVSFAMAYVARLEQAKIELSSVGQRTIPTGDLEYSYELAFLRIFGAWETLLEDSLIRLICGYHHSGGQEPLAPGVAYLSNVANARMALLQGRPFRQWYDPAQILARAQRFFIGSRYELVIASAQARVSHFASIRHRIAHVQSHARAQFDNATMSLNGKRYPGSRPGRFLREWHPSFVPPRRWLDIASSELVGLGHQICK